MSAFKKMNLGVCTAIGILGAAGITALLLLGASFLVLSGYFPENGMRALAFSAEGMGIFASSVILFRFRKKQLLPTAGCISCGICAVMCLLTATVGGKDSANTVLMHLLACAAGFVFSLLLGGKKKKRKRHK